MNLLDFIERANIIHNNKYSYLKTNYQGINEKVIITCYTHGDFVKEAGEHLRKKRNTGGCPECKKDERIKKILSKFIDKFGNKYNYDNISTMHKHCKIICPFHGEFLQSPMCHLVSKTGCPQCSGITKYDNSVIDQILINDNRLIKRQSNYISLKHKLQFICEVCDYKWSCQPYDLLFDGTGCPACSNRRRLNNQIIDERLIDKSLIRKGDFINSDTKLKFSCNFCNYEWDSLIHDVLGGHGCPSCAKNVRLTNEIIDKKLETRNIQRLEDCNGSHGKINFKCLICDYIWKTEAKVIINIGCGCPKCNSKGVNELLIFNILKDSMINFIFQAKINEIIPEIKNRQRFDFWFPNNKIAVEYNGSQHYRPVKFGGISEERAQVNFLRQQERDDKKRFLCKNNDINLIEIDGRKYSNNKLEKYLLQELIPYIKDYNANS